MMLGFAAGVLVAEVIDQHLAERDRRWAQDDLEAEEFVGQLQAARSIEIVPEIVGIGLGEAAVRPHPRAPIRWTQRARDLAFFALLFAGAFLLAALMWMFSPGAGQ